MFRSMTKMDWEKGKTCWINSSETPFFYLFLPLPPRTQFSPSNMSVLFFLSFFFFIQLCSHVKCCCNTWSAAPPPVFFVNTNDQQQERPGGSGHVTGEFNSPCARYWDHCAFSAKGLFDELPHRCIIPQLRLKKKKKKALPTSFFEWVKAAFSPFVLDLEKGNAAAWTVSMIKESKAR